MELKVIVPTSLSEITLSQYQRFARLEGDDEFISKKMLDIFCNVPLEELPNIKFKDVSRVSSKLTNMMRERPKLTQKFKIKGKEFGFIPSLEDISYGEFVDLDTYMADTKNLHKTMAVLYRPITKKIGKRYRIEEYDASDKYFDMMLDAPMNIVMGAMVFFWTLGKDLLGTTLTSLKNEIQKKNSKTSAVKEHLPKDGDGILHSIHLVKEMLEDLTKSQEYQHPNALPIYPLKSTEQKQKAKSSKEKQNETVL
tara:strand:- start:601 stop:1359 length:759 start_codon:yes stop_codon:yes gene_type:complete